MYAYLRTLPADEWPEFALASLSIVLFFGLAFVFKFGWMYCAAAAALGGFAVMIVYDSLQLSRRVERAKERARQLHINYHHNRL